MQNYTLSSWDYAGLQTIHGSRNNNFTSGLIANMLSDSLLKKTLPTNTFFLSKTFSSWPQAWKEPSNIHLRFTALQVMSRFIQRELAELKAVFKQTTSQMRQASKSLHFRALKKLDRRSSTSPPSCCKKLMGFSTHPNPMARLDQHLLIQTT